MHNNRERNCTTVLHLKVTQEVTDIFCLLLFQLLEYLCQHVDEWNTTLGCDLCSNNKLVYPSDEGKNRLGRLSYYLCVAITWVGLEMLQYNIYLYHGHAFSQAALLYLEQICLLFDSICTFPMMTLLTITLLPAGPKSLKMSKLSACFYLT